jgi:arsenite-transporting ATPase
MKTGPSFLSDHGFRLLLFGGKGGVGKTSCATATALRWARNRPDRSVLLVSTDPAHSLADSTVGFSPPHNMEVVELDAQACLSTFKEKHSERFREIVSRGTFFDEEDISQILDLSLPGLDELMAFLEIAKWVEEERYHCIVVDTAPTGHTLRLLAMPALIKKWLEALDALLAKHRYMKQLFGGAYQQDQLDEFLLELSASVKQTQGLLGDPVHCRFVPVMLAEELSVRETVLLLSELKRLGIPVADIVVNRVYPENACATCARKRASQIREIRQLPDECSECSLWGVPMYPEEIRGSGPLETFWEGVFPLAHTKSLPAMAFTAGDARLAKSNGHPRVEDPGNLPAPEKRFLIFAGKGGVGKTTLACATALRMARDPEGGEVLLFSTDPAHSLSDCLDAPIGPEPTRLAPGLTAMEIDAQAEFETLKKQYAEELEMFFGAISANLDLTFDREVMERVMDLSPPGLDEVMALTAAMGFLAQGQYHVFILDSAPTGHLIRLLETPELIEQWLKVFFNLFLKYKNVFRLPGISQRLIQISKNLKLLRATLRNSGQSALYAVTILTEMAYQETNDLVTACERMGVSVAMLFLNQATPASECPLCSALRRGEARVKEKFQRRYSVMPQGLIYHLDEPRGLQRLGELGEVLYNRGGTKGSMERNSVAQARYLMRGGF